MAAATYLDTLDWDGSVYFVPASDNATQPQALRWPRTGVACREDRCGLHGDTGQHPQGAAYLALQLAKDPTLINPDPNPVPVGLYVKRSKLGDSSRSLLSTPTTRSQPLRNRSGADQEVSMDP